MGMYNDVAHCGPFVFPALNDVVAGKYDIQLSTNMASRRDFILCIAQLKTTTSKDSDCRLVWSI